MSRPVELVFSGQARAAPGARMPPDSSAPQPPGANGLAPLTPPRTGDVVTYRALREHAGDLRATVRGHHRRGGVDIDVHIPGCTEPLTLTNIAFYPEDQCPRGGCYQRGA